MKLSASLHGLRALLATGDARPRRGGKGFGEILVCQVGREAGYRLHLRKSGTQIVVLDAKTHTEGHDSASPPPCRPRCPIVAVLPKSHYLVKTLAVPKNLGAQTRAVLQLEAESLLPPEFGEVDISYRRLEDQADGLDRYEIYLARQGDLADYIARLSRFVGRPDWLMPSAVLWRRLLEGLSDVDMLVARNGEQDRAESFSVNADGTVSIRELDVDACRGQSPVGARLAEMIRWSLTRVSTQERPLTIAWLGAGCPAASVNGQIRFVDHTALTVAGVHPDDAAGRPGPALYAAAAMALEYDDEPFRDANLLPQTLLEHRRRGVLYKNLAAACTAIVLSLAGTLGSLKLIAHRYRSANRQLAAAVSRIRDEGQRIGRQYAQLRAVKAVRGKSNDLLDVIAALHKATPAGVTYNGIELTSEDELRLRGQANSMSLPFLLPERLEAQALFRDVTFQGAGQKTRGAGSRTDFRVDCVINRSEHP